MRQILSDPRARQKPCLRCERSLLKHLDDRYCPDCGLSVWMSLNATDGLDRSRPQWLRGAAQGAWLLALAQPIALVAYLIAMLGHQLPSLRSDLAVGMAQFGDDGEEAAAATQPMAEMAMSARHAPPSVWIAIAMILIGGYFVVSTIGLLRLTIPERRYPDRQAATRRWARITAGVATFIGVILIALGATHLHRGWPTESGASWLTLIVVELTFAGVACCTWAYVRPIARRGGQSSIAKLCGYLLFLPLLTFAKAAPFIGLWFLYLLMPLATLLPLVYLPLSVWLLVRVARMLQRAAPHADAAWAAETRPANQAQPVAV